MQYKHQSYDETVNVTKSNPLKDFATYTISILLLIWMVYLVSGLIIDVLAKNISHETELKIWNKVFSDKFLIDENPELLAKQKYLQSILDKIPKQESDNYNYSILIVEDEEVNALALPSGKIIIYTGLLNKLKTENALTFVIGHELGHFTNRDHLRAMGRTLIANIILLPLINDSTGSSITGYVMNKMILSYSRSQEMAADENGLKALEQIYGHAGGATEFFENIKEGKIEALLAKYSSTHPISEDRINHIQNLIKDRQLKTLPTKAIELPK